ncbi:MAG: transcription elongation factor GreA [Patescibacteria group bacterium]|nr:transcription elongation factor GreA [Patescibacteria group bacterium]
MEKKVFTEEGLRKLKEELDYLKNEKRHQVADRIKQAKEYGDLSENAEYQDAKDEQAFVEGRILELEHIVKSAIAVDNNGGKKGRIFIGSKVKVDRDKGQILEFEIVGSMEADPVNGKISIESPLGAALIDKKVGDEVAVELPAGLVKYKILEIN